MPRGNSFKRAFSLKSLLEMSDGVTVPEIMAVFDIKKPSAQRMIDQIGDIFPVFEDGHRHRRGRPPAIIYKVMI